MATPTPFRHGLRTMVGRDPHDEHRAATPLELLYDLVFVISFGVAGSEFAHLAAEGYVSEGLVAFCFAMFAVIWAWINFTWFASAFDTDDWTYRLLVMAQMIGVVVLAMGLHDMFDSVHHHESIDNAVMVVGYVIMRVPMIGLWLRVYRQDAACRANARWYLVTLSVAQVLWCLSLLADVQIGTYLLIVAPIVLIEMAGPYLAERRDGGTPWHAHHIAERYGLLAIISLGEILIGTVAALNSVIEIEGWTAEIAAFGALGVILAFGLWWIYFALPAGEVLHSFRGRSFPWGYGHLLVYTAISAVGAGLHVAALWFEDHSELGVTAVMATIVVPVMIYLVVTAALYVYLVPIGRGPLVMLTGAVLVVAGLSLLIVAAGAPLIIGLAVLAASPWLAVAAIELGVGDRVEDSAEQYLA